MVDRPYQFVGPILKACSSLAETLGTDVMYSDKATYNRFLLSVCLDSMILKILQDLNPLVVTDSALIDRLNRAIDTGATLGDRSAWPGWIVLQVPPGELAKYGATEADTVPVLQAKIDAYNAGQQALTRPAAAPKK